MKIKGQPNLDKLKRALKPHIDTLKKFSHTTQKKVLFTEMGYRSIKINTEKPWEWPSELDVPTKVYSEESQAIAYKALFASTFGKNWFAGGFIWEYDLIEGKGPAALHRLNFSPRHKMSENIIKEYYWKNY